MKREGNMCKNYLNLEGSCFFNGSTCCNPFSVEGCDIQRRDIFKNDPISHKHYEPDEKSKTLTKRKIWNMMGVKKGDVIGDWTIRYCELEEMIIDPGIAIDYAIEQVKEKFKSVGVKMKAIRVFHNVEILNKEYGIYVIGIGQQS